MEQGLKFCLWCDTVMGYLYLYKFELGLCQNVITDLTKQFDGTGASFFVETYFSSPKLTALLCHEEKHFIEVVRKDGIEKV